MCDPNVLPEQVALNTGDTVSNQYEVIKALGEGAFGIVYLVKYRQQGTLYVIKVLKSWSFANKDRVNLIKRFNLEFETGRIESKFLVRSMAQGCIEGNPYIVMEYCPNGDLRKKMRERLLSERELGLYANDMLQGLHALHSNGKTHRDLKPENVLLNNDNTAKLTDFGIVGHANMSRLTQMDWLGRPTEVFGTPAYMPPEQLDPRSKKQTILPTIDIFAFGVILYELLTGHYPFGQPPRDDKEIIAYNKRVLHGQWDHPHRYNTNISNNWLEVLEGCLEADYKRRFQTAELVLKKIGTPPIQTPIHLPTPQSRTGAVGLQIMQGEEFGKIYNLTKMIGTRTAGVLTLGWRDAQGKYRNDVAITEEQSSYISRAHATIEKHNDTWTIRDGQYTNKEGVMEWHRSMNGTYVNGVEVTDHFSKQLTMDDIVTVGNTTLKMIVL